MQLRAQQLFQLQPQTKEVVHLLLATEEIIHGNNKLLICICSNTPNHHPTCYEGAQ